jgi:hypothetical protein
MHARDRPRLNEAAALTPILRKKDRDWFEPKDENLQIARSG